MIGGAAGNNATVIADPDADVIDGRYALESVIGRGAMAEVRGGEDLRLGRAIAVKLLHENLAAQPESRLRFEEEARAAARLTDPNVVAIYDTGEHRGRPFIVMERLPGRTLHDELREGPLSEARARQVIAQVLRALHAAHSAGVVHRDVKPANILLTANGDAKVADFGIAKVAESNDLTATGLLLGTPSYLAPECVTGHPATVASDIYAVGVVLYEALSGVRPFTGDTAIAVCHAIVSEAPRPLRALCPGVSAEIAAVVAHAMAKDPARRYRSAEEMMRALDGETVPSVTSVDQDTQPIDAEATLIGMAPPTEVLAPVAAGATARVAAPRPRRRGVKVLVGAGAVVLGAIALFAAMNHDADPATKAPAVTATTAVAQTTVTAAPVTTVPVTTLPVTEPTKPKKDNPGHGHQKPPKPGKP